MTATNVEPMLEPNLEQMQAHLEHLFGGDLHGYHDGLIEIARQANMPNASGRFPVNHAELFPVEELDAAIARAVAWNRAGHNVYVGAALRKPDTPRVGRCDDEDVHAQTSYFVDIDDPAAARRARSHYEEAPPTLAVVTGRHPDLRAQLWWRLETPDTDPASIETHLRGLAAAFGGDMKTTNPGRVMRIGGSIAWPVKNGRLLEQTEVQRPKKAPTFYIDTILEAAYPPIAEVPRTSGTAHNNVAIGETPDGPLGMPEERIIDGRETYMRDTVFACFVEFIGENGAAPTPDELFELAWPQYSRKVDFSRAGRGPDEMMEKCEYVVRRFGEGRLPGLRTLESVIEAYQGKQARQEQERAQRATGSAPLGEFRLLDWTADRYLGEAPPITWLCEGTIQLGVPVLVAAMGGLGKSYIAIDMALTIALGVTSVKPKRVLGGPLTAHGTAVVLSAEDSHASIHRRLNKIDPDHKRDATEARLIIVPMPDAGGPRPLVTQVNGAPEKTPFFDEFKRQLCEIPDLRLVVIDPLQAFVMSDVTSDPAAGQFMWSAFAEICAATGATIMVTHHMRKDGARRIETADEAREAIRGSTALVDGARATYALWKEPEENARRICSEMGEEFTPGRIVRGAVVKVNDEADLTVHTYVRSDTGLLEDRTEQVDADAPPAELNRPDIIRLQDEIERRWKNGSPFSETYHGGPRYIVPYMCRTFRVSRRYAEQFIADWLGNGIVAVEVRNSKTKVKGLKLMQKVYFSSGGATERDHPSD